MPEARIGQDNLGRYELIYTPLPGEPVSENRALSFIFSQATAIVKRARLPKGEDDFQKQIDKAIDKLAEALPRDFAETLVFALYKEDVSTIWKLEFNGKTTADGFKITAIRDADKT